MRDTNCNTADKVNIAVRTNRKWALISTLVQNFCLHWFSLVESKILILTKLNSWTTSVYITNILVYIMICTFFSFNY